MRLSIILERTLKDKDYLYVFGKKSVFAYFCVINRLVIKADKQTKMTSFVAIRVACKSNIYGR